MLKTVFFSVSDNGNVNSSTTNEIIGPTQTVVPQYLVDSFLSMVNLSGRQHDNDMSFHCAYSMPAVISTLGKEYWPLMKEPVRALAGRVLKLKCCFLIF